MTKPSNISGIETAKGRSWDEWVKFLDKANCRDMDHRAIADVVYEELENKIDSAGWWSQGVTVAYEQHIGRRQPGQRSDGTFEFSVNRNMDGGREDIFARVLDWADTKKDFRDTDISNVRTSVTDVRSYWRCDLADGTKLDIAVGPRSGGNYMVTITQSKLASQAASDKWRDFWKQTITEL